MLIFCAKIVVKGGKKIKKGVASHCNISNSSRLFSHFNECGKFLFATCYWFLLIIFYNF